MKVPASHNGRYSQRGENKQAASYTGSRRSNDAMNGQGDERSEAVDMFVIAKCGWCRKRQQSSTDSVLFYGLGVLVLLTTATMAMWSAKA